MHPFTSSRDGSPFGRRPARLDVVLLTGAAALLMTAVLSACHIRAEPPFYRLVGVIPVSDAITVCRQTFNPMPRIGPQPFLDLSVTSESPGHSRFAFILSADTVHEVSQALESATLVAGVRRYNFGGSQDSLFLFQSELGIVRQAVALVTESEVREILQSRNLSVEIPTEGGIKNIACSFGCRERLRGFFSLVGPDAGDRACWYRGQPEFVAADPWHRVLRHLSPW